jgi:hypothetical protein
MKAVIKVSSTFVIAAAIVALSISPCRADITGVSTTGGATASVVYVGPVCYTGYSCGPYKASVVSDTITAGSSELLFHYTSPPSGSDSGYNGERLILEVINGTGSTLGTFDFTMAGGTFGAPLALPDLGSYNGATTPPTYTDGPRFGSLNGTNTVWTANLNLAAGAEKDFYLAVNYGSGTPGDSTLTQTAVPEPGFYSVFGLGLGLGGLLLFVWRKREA